MSPLVLYYNNKTKQRRTKVFYFQKGIQNSNLTLRLVFVIRFLTQIELDPTSKLI